MKTQGSFSISIFVVVVALLFAATASFGSLVYVGASSGEAGSGSSGGGGGGGVSRIQPDSSSDIFLDMGWLKMSIWSRNEEAWFHEVERAEGEGHWHEKSASGFISLNVYNGYDDIFAVPISSSAQLMRTDDAGRFMVGADFCFLFTDELTPLEDLPSQSFYYSLGDMSYNFNTSLRHDSIWIWDELAEEGEEIITDDITGHFSIWFEDAEITSSFGSVNRYDYWHNDTLHEGFHASGTFYMQYTGTADELEEFNRVVKLATIPEPATLIILSLGVASMMRWRRS